MNLIILSQLLHLCFLLIRQPNGWHLPRWGRQDQRSSYYISGSEFSTGFPLWKTFRSAQILCSALWKTVAAFIFLPFMRGKFTLLWKSFALNSDFSTELSTENFVFSCCKASKYRLYALFCRVISKSFPQKRYICGKLFYFSTFVFLRCE